MSTLGHLVLDTSVIINELFYLTIITQHNNLTSNVHIIENWLNAI